MRETFAKAQPPLSSFLECCYLLWANGLQLHNRAAISASKLHTHTRKHTNTHLQKAGRVNCDAITSFSKIVSCFFSDGVFSDTTSTMDIREGSTQLRSEGDDTAHAHSLHPVKPRGCQGYSDARELRVLLFNLQNTRGTIPSQKKDSKNHFKSKKRTEKKTCNIKSHFSARSHFGFDYG